MYISERMIRGMEEKYGTPREMHLRIEMLHPEYGLMKRSMHDGRAHDITLFIFKNGDLVVIRKPMHPRGVFRAPSGGIRRDESIEEGALREAYEETGLAVKLERYVLRVYAIFTCGDESESWTSHVFQARYVSGELGQIDTEEISDVKLVSLEELSTTIRDCMLASGSGGLKYRVLLTDAALEEILGKDI